MKAIDFIHETKMDTIITISTVENCGIESKTLRTGKFILNHYEYSNLLDREILFVSAIALNHMIIRVI